MKYSKSIYTFVHVQGQVNRNFQLVLNETGPGRQVGQVGHGISTALCKTLQTVGGGGGGGLGLPWVQQLAFPTM